MALVVVVDNGSGSGSSSKLYFKLGLYTLCMSKTVSILVRNMTCYMIWELHHEFHPAVQGNFVSFTHQGSLQWDNNQQSPGLLLLDQESLF